MTVPVWTALHQMRYEKDGEIETWICDECGKRIRTEPDFFVEKLGDPAAVHFGSVGGLSIGKVEVRQEPHEGL